MGEQTVSQHAHGIIYLSLRPHLMVLGFLRSCMNMDALDLEQYDAEYERSEICMNEEEHVHHVHSLRSNSSIHSRSSSPVRALSNRGPYGKSWQSSRSSPRLFNSEQLQAAALAVAEADSQRTGRR